MILDYMEYGAVKIDMTEYIEKKFLYDLPTQMQGQATTPESYNPYVIDNNSKALNKEESDRFHSKVATLLFLTMHGRPDLLTEIYFLCTRVKLPNEDDKMKLGRVMKYLNTTKDIILRLKADNLNLVKWWVDASFAVYSDMPSHTGSAMSSGKGVIYSNSSKQKINTKSSTECELIGTNDVLPQALWMKYFLDHQ